MRGGQLVCQGVVLPRRQRGVPAAARARQVSLLFVFFFLDRSRARGAGANMKPGGVGSAQQHVARSTYVRRYVRTPVQRGLQGIHVR
jgi:hypothetical protein